MTDCYYCRSPSVRVRYRNEFHKVDKSFGPFDFGECESCGSLFTLNPPSPDRLATFYRSYDDFRPDWYRSGAAAGALESQYKFYARYVRGTSVDNWVDVGAGHGEIASIVVKDAPHGTAIDIAPRPSRLPPSVQYFQIDMNRDGWAEEVPVRYANVFSVAVLEHVLSPSAFMRECLSLVAPGGQLTMICPDYSSLARKVLGRSWPYFEPGEHVSVPTKKGAARCMSEAQQRLGLAGRVEVKSITVGYSVRYLLEVLRLSAIAAITPPKLSAPLPTGILSARFYRDQA